VSEESVRPIIIKRVKKHAHGHHGGSWKVAYADFVTAMMAFFLLMWLMGSTTKEERAAISEYFTEPSMVEGESPTKAAHSTPIQGAGGASTSLIELGGSANPEFEQSRVNIAEKGHTDEKSLDVNSAEAIARDLEKQRLEELMETLNEAIAASQALAPYKDQLLIDITPEGLRIQIIDKENRPMFDLSSTELKNYSVGILHEISKVINTVPNNVSISGHTDALRYTGRPNYSNWELSADRANTARRALVEGGMDENKIARVVGLGSSVNFNKDNPLDASNRRISILVMNRDLEASISP
jgi:chemotaxis protein MotB